eukprot:4335431-Prymnesium_polylepis.2
MGGRRVWWPAGAIPSIGSMRRRRTHRKMSCTTNVVITLRSHALSTTWKPPGACRSTMIV